MVAWGKCVRRGESLSPSQSKKNFVVRVAALMSNSEIHEVILPVKFSVFYKFVISKRVNTEFKMCMANAVKLLWLLKCPVQNIKIPKVNLSCCCLKCLLCKQVVQIDFFLRGGDQNGRGWRAKS